MPRKGKGKRGGRKHKKKKHSAEETELWQEKQARKADRKDKNNKKRAAKKMWRGAARNKQQAVTMATHETREVNKFYKSVSHLKMKDIFAEEATFKVGETVQVHNVAFKKTQDGVVSVSIPFYGGRLPKTTLVGRITKVIPSTQENIKFEGYNIRQESTGVEMFVPFHYQPYTLRVAPNELVMASTFDCSPFSTGI